MDHVFARLVRGGLIGAASLLAACRCDPMKVVRSPAALSGQTIPIAPTKEDCQRLCGPSVTKCERVPIATDPIDGPARGTAATDFTVLCTVPRYCPGGRAPAGYHHVALAATAAGEHFAELAQVEAASVRAFEELAVELSLHGAPAELVRAALRSAREEVAHANAMAALARSFGTSPSAPHVTPTPPRPLGEILVENAVEGLVNERYGAALAAVRAERAIPEVAHAMHAIAHDEARHAQLADAIHGWGMRHLSRAGRSRVLEARDRARAELAAAIDREPSCELAVIGGMPSATRANDVLATI